MRSRRARSCISRGDDTGTSAVPGERRTARFGRAGSAFRDGDLLLRLGALGLGDFGRFVEVGDGARVLEVVPYLVVLIGVSAPQVTLMAHARDLLSR
jgi:hypothetical protein